MGGGGKKSMSSAVQKLCAVQLQTSCYGTCIPLLWGTNRVSPNLIDYTDFVGKEVDSGTRTGKGGGGSITTQSYTYSASVVFALCEGVVADFGTVFKDTEVGTVESYGFTTFEGDRPQAVWSYMQSAHPDRARAYSGTALVCQANMALNSDATIGNYSFELTMSGAIVNGPGAPDANAADYITDFLTNPYYGAGWATADIYDLTQLRDYVDAMGLWQSPVLNEQKQALEHLRDLLQGVNADGFVGGDGTLKIQPYGDVPVVANGATYTPNTTPVYDFGPDDFIVDNPADDPIKITRADHDDTYNTVPVEFLDRSNQYNTKTVWSTEPVDADLYGIRTDSVKTQHGITRQVVALMLSRILAQRSVYIRNQFTFMVGWRYIPLEPLDLVTVTSPKQQLTRVVARVKKVKEDDRGRLEITAEEWPFGVAHATQFATQSTDGGTRNPLVDPGNVNTPAIFDLPLYLTSTGGAALGVAASGGSDWGGCEVWMSTDGQSYALQGRLTRAGRYGVTTSVLPRTFTVSKVSGSNAWDTSPFVNAAVGSGSISATAADTTSHVMVGYAPSAVNNGSYTQAIAAYFGAGTVEIYNLGTQVGVYGTYVVGDTLETKYDGAQITFYHNGVQIGPAIAHTGSLYPIVPLYDVGASVNDVELSPDVAQSAWSVPNNATVTADTAADDNEVVLGVDLTESGGGTLGTVDAALNADFANLSLVDNELVSFQTATLTAAGKYNLTSIYRGVLGTLEGSHAVGARFVRIDDGVLEIPITPARIGSTLYFKFLSFNKFGKALQQLSDVTPYTYVPAPSWSLSSASSNFTVFGSVNAIAFEWGQNLMPGAYVVELWEGATATAFADGAASKIWEGTATGKLWPKADTTTRYYWIRPRAADGRYGAVVPSGNGRPGAASVVTTSLVLGISPGSATSSGTATSQTTNSVTVNPTGGTAPYTYAWSWHDGGSGITIGAPSSQATNFSATGLGLRETRSGTAQCVVTDNIGQRQTIFVSVQISETATAVSASASPTSESASGASASEVTGSSTVSASGGLGPYTYSWGWISGGAGITIGSPTSATTNFTAGSLASGQTVSGTARCTVTDSFGQTATADVTVSLSRASAVSATASPTIESTSSNATTQTTGTTSVSASGGSAPYTYAWTWQSGGVGISINSPNSAATSFTASGLNASGETRSGVAICTVTDSLGQQATCTVSVSIQCVATAWNFTITAGTLNSAYVTYVGYEQGSIGSESGFSGPGTTLVSLQDSHVSTGTYGSIQIGGFSSDPGQALFSSITANGVTLYTTNASYSYSGGTATWTWYSNAFGFGNAGTYPVTLTK
jgi:hypothetical protein